MTRRSEESSGLPSFFQDNPWLDILAQRGVEPSPDFTASEASSAPTVKRAKPAIEPEPIVSSPTTPAADFPRELVVRLEVPSELVEAIKELKDTIIMALSVSQRQATIVPIYIPISVAQMIPRAPLQASNSTEAAGEVLCPKCGRPGRLYEFVKRGRAYICVLHGRSRCYLGPADRVKEKWPFLLQTPVAGMFNGGRAGTLLPCLSGLVRQGSRVQIPAGAPPLQPEEVNLMVEHCSTYGK